MSVIDSNIKFVGINPNYPTAEKKSSQVNAAQEVVTMQDITDTVLSVSQTPPDPAPLAFANAATNGVLSPTPNYNNGTLGVGATLIGSTNGALTDGTSAGKIDSTYTPVVGDIILVKNQTVSANPTLNKAFQNGLYVINDVGSVSAPYQLTRVVDFDTSTELYPLQINILSGNNNALKYFIQTTVNPVIGTSNLIFSISSAQSIVSQISFVDTVIDTALSNITYANGTVIISIPGNGATLTSTVNGALGTWNGLTANTNSSVANSFTKVLVINQTNPAHNGDYQVINAGSSSTPWKLVRINNTASGFNRYTRYFVVSNTGSTKAGKVYFTAPNSPVLTNANIGTAQINIFEYGGGVPTLQEVLDNNHDLVDGNNFQGTNAGDNSDSINMIAIGEWAGSYTSVDDVINIGNFSGSNSSGSHCIYIGKNAGTDSSGDTSISIGADTGAYSTGKGCISLGQNAGYSNTGDDCISIGNNSGLSNTGDSVLSIGTVQDNTLPNVSIVDNNLLPSFADRSAAVTYFDVIGVAQHVTYMYYNESTFAIEGYRIV